MLDAGATKPIFSTLVTCKVGSVVRVAMFCIIPFPGVLGQTGTGESVKWLKVEPELPLKVLAKRKLCESNVGAQTWVRHEMGCFQTTRVI